MNVTFACPECERPVRTVFDATSKQLVCPACSTSIVIPDGAVEANSVRRCLICPSVDLYVRKDFPQRVGVALVLIGVIGSSIAWGYANVFWTFAILFGTALADLLLFLVVGNALMCYRCQAQYRGIEELKGHGAFDLETHERYRQLKARIEH